jgi:Tfp pilus assembly protein PilO
MKSLGRRATIAIAAVACLAVLAGGWFLLIKPARSDIAKTKAQTAQQQADNQSAQLQLASMRSIAKHLPAEQAELATLQKKVPSQVELPAILRSMQSLAISSGVHLTSFQPTVPSPLTNAPGISSVGIVMSVSGGYAELEQLDSALEGLQRTFMVSGFTFTGTGGTSTSSITSTSSSSSSSSSGAPDLITATFTGRVLVKTPAAAATGSTTSSSATSSSTTGTSGH